MMHDDLDAVLSQYVFRADEHSCHVTNLARPTALLVDCTERRNGEVGNENSKQPVFYSRGQVIGIVVML